MAVPIYEMRVAKLLLLKEPSFGAETWQWPPGEVKSCKMQRFHTCPVRSLKWPHGHSTSHFQWNRPAKTSMVMQWPFESGRFTVVIRKSCGSSFVNTCCSLACNTKLPTVDHNCRNQMLSGNGMTARQVAMQWMVLIQYLLLKDQGGQPGHKGDKRHSLELSLPLTLGTPIYQKWQIDDGWCIVLIWSYHITIITLTIYTLANKTREKLRVELQTQGSCCKPRVCKIQSVPVLRRCDIFFPNLDFNMFKAVCLSLDLKNHRWKHVFSWLCHENNPPHPVLKRTVS